MPIGSGTAQFFDMALTSPYTYDFDTNPQVAYVRLMIPDTVNTEEQPAIFNDNEINAFYRIQQSQFQSSMFFSGVAGRNLPSLPVSYLRVAALALDTLANNSAQLGIITKLLDVSLSPKDAAAALQSRADSLRKTDDESGAFVVVEQVNTVWGYLDRYWKQVQRQTGGGGIA